MGNMGTSNIDYGKHGLWVTGTLGNKGYEEHGWVKYQLQVCCDADRSRRQHSFPANLQGRPHNAELGPSCSIGQLRRDKKIPQNSYFRG